MGAFNLTCGLEEDQLNILFYLLMHKCTGPDSSRSFKVIEKVFRDQMEVEKVINSLIPLGYVNRKKKKAYNYWIIPGPSIRALQDHGYRIPRGGRVVLE